jgi:hypothetical protein
MYILGHAVGVWVRVLRGGSVYDITMARLPFALVVPEVEICTVYARRLSIQIEADGQFCGMISHHIDGLGSNIVVSALGLLQINGLTRRA